MQRKLNRAIAAVSCTSLLTVGAVSAVVLSGSTASASEKRHSETTEHHRHHPSPSPSKSGVTPSPSTATPTSTPTTPAVSPSATASGTSGFVTVCGTQLCVNGSVFTLKSATAYGTYNTPSAEASLAQAGGLNVVDADEFQVHYHQLSDAMAADTWNRMDAFIAAMEAKGIRVILNFSEYYQDFQAAGITPTTQDWESYLSFVANRTNTVTGVQYKNDPGIAFVEMIGEPDAPNYNIHPGVEGTTQQLTDFYSRSLAEWKALAPNILATTGGFSYINDPNSGIDWKTIISDPNDAIAQMEINSSNDQNTTVPMFTAQAQADDKPWELSAWSSCYVGTSGKSGYNWYPDDASMAAHASAMYNISAGNGGAAYQAVGAEFWNLKDNGGNNSGHCDLNTSFPETWAVVQGAP